MTELIIYILGFIIGFTLSIFILRLNKIKNDNLMKEINIFCDQIKYKSETEKREDILNFMLDKIFN